MDATPVRKKSSAAADADADTVPSAAQQAAAEQSSSPESNAAVVAGVRASGGDEDDDEQVERFYALLDNIRAMRGMIGTGGTGTATGRKRARDAEPPWRPAFRMEDFELEQEVDSVSAGCSGEKKKKKKKRGSSAELPAASDEEEQGEVVEAKAPRRGQPQSHKARRAGVLAVDS